MAKWAANCGYCGKAGSGNLDKYVCPECQRTGCLTCMPTGSAAPCSQCEEQAERDRFDNPRKIR